MQIVNDCTGRILADQATLATSSFARMKGLLGTASLPIGHALIIKPCSSIHTFGMRYAIDVLFCDQEGVVLKCVENLPAWRMVACWSSQFVIELPAGTIEKAHTSQRHLLRIEN